MGVNMWEKGAPGEKQNPRDSEITDDARTQTAEVVRFSGGVCVWKGWGLRTWSLISPRNNPRTHQPNPTQPKPIEPNPAKGPRLRILPIDSPWAASRLSFIWRLPILLSTRDNRV